MSERQTDDGGLSTDSDAEQETDIDEVTGQEREIQELLTSNNTNDVDSDRDEAEVELDTESSPGEANVNNNEPACSLQHGSIAANLSSEGSLEGRLTADARGRSFSPSRSPHRRSGAPPSYSASGQSPNNPNKSAKSQRPPLYAEVPSFRSAIQLPGDDNATGQDEAKAAANADASSDDESMSLLAAHSFALAKPLYAVGEGDNMELREIRGAQATIEVIERHSPVPPSYDVAMARVDAGLARQKETTFFTDIDPEQLNVPPPEYTDVALDDEPHAEEVHGERDLPTASPSDIEATAAASSSSDEDPSSFVVVRLWRRFLRCRRHLTTSRKRNIIITSVVMSCILLLIILFPIQFSYVSYYEYALVRTKSTGRVSTDRVYEHGCYILGADKEFVYLDRTVQTIEFYNLGMFTKDNVDLAIDVKMYYLVNYEDVAQLWKDYAGKHTKVIENIAKTTIRNCAARVSQEQYILEREYVEELLHEALKYKFVTWGISIPYFNYLNLHLPLRIIQKKIQLLVIRTEIEKELAYQQQRQIELETELLTTPIIYTAKEAINNGTAEAAAIKTVSLTTKAQHVDVTHSNAFRSMMNTLNITNMDHALSFYYLATLNTMSHLEGVVEYTKSGLYAPKVV